MRGTHLENLDLNLLHSLEALIAEQSVTGAARRLGLSQPAASRALGRLREHLDDPLLVRAGRRMLLTARARDIGPRLREALRQLDAALAGSTPFSPGASRRTFRIATVDYAAAVLVPSLVGRLAAAAPGMELVVANQREDFSAALESGALDLVIVPRREAWVGVIWRPCFRDRYICLVRRDHPAVRDRLSLATYVRLDHVIVSPLGRGASVVDEALAKLGRKRRIAARVPSFLLAPHVVMNSDLILTTFSRLVSPPFSTALRRLSPPMPLPELAVSLAWHESASHDPGHAWFRALVSETAAGLPAS